MKALLWFSCFSFSLFGQDTIQVVKQRNYFPWLAERQFGEIPYFLLCDSNGIYTKENCSITQFNLSYFSSDGMKDIEIKGYQIPDSICLEIGRFAIGTPIFISNIHGTIEDEKVLLNSMKFQIMKKENE
ncbi:MAG: hypothetical protein KJ941_09090 [Bacteroidetes bacterium]|nr:hypothetical protein [Bacteroidota bacterium]